MRIVVHICGTFLALLGVVSSAAAAEDRLSPNEVEKLAANGGYFAFTALRTEARHEDLRAGSAVIGAVKVGGDEGVQFAREVFSWGNPYLDQYALMGLGENTSSASLDLLREKASEFASIDSQREEAAGGAWAHVFRTLHAGDAVAIAENTVADETRSPFERALYLRIFIDQTVDRATALRIYRPFLENPARELRRVAVAANGFFWDAEMLPAILRLENDKEDPVVRNKARYIARRYLRYGPEGPKQGESETSPSYLARHPKPYDPEGYAAWLARDKEWGRVQTLLLTGHEPPPPAPTPPSFEMRNAATPSKDSEGKLLYRP
ncbi:MAG TPA: hypothetical protein DEP35_12535 [Deltaproteobacteria bacterium]|jgi:hypothetical protein|nr:hypothetical protein [Deltaproteobacteria bacterium]